MFNLQVQQHEYPTCFSFLLRLTSAAILSAVYAWPSLTERDEDTLKRIETVNTRLAYAIAPGNSPVDIFPMLKYLPSSLAKWKRDAIEWNASETALFKKFNQAVANSMVCTSHNIYLWVLLSTRCLILYK